MVHLSGGRFPLHLATHAQGAQSGPDLMVTVGAFCIDRTEVTVAAYMACVRDGACPAPSGPAGGDAGDCNALAHDRDLHPMNCVDWPSAQAYCSAKGKRLPTEVEWSSAARGAEGRVPPWGNAPVANDHANLQSAEDGWDGTAPVGSFPRGATPEGILDLAGNVTEWTASRYCESPNWPRPWGTCEQAQRIRPDARTMRVVVGGNAFLSLGLPATVDGMPESWSARAVGFRCASASASAD